jgi:hypothetical protein
MASDDNKNYSLNLSSQMILGLIVTFLPIIGGAAYTGINFWAKMNKTIEAVDRFKPYDDTDFREKIRVFEIEMKSVKERQINIAEQAVKVAEKASDAVALARETKAIAAGSATENAAQSREVQARLAALKQDLDNTAAALRSEMNMLKKATTNKLGN